MTNVCIRQNRNLKSNFIVIDRDKNFYDLHYQSLYTLHYIINETRLRRCTSVMGARLTHSITTRHIAGRVTIHYVYIINNSLKLLFYFPTIICPLYFISTLVLIRICLIVYTLKNSANVSKTLNIIG